MCAFCISKASAKTDAFKKVAVCANLITARPALILTLLDECEKPGSDLVF